VSARTDVLLWAQRMLAMTSAPPHQLLEIKADAGIDVAQEAFHRIARTNHPDLHRSGLTPEELETVTIAYSRCAGAYQDFRTQRMQANRMKPFSNATPVQQIARVPTPAQQIGRIPGVTKPAPAPGAPKAPPGPVPSAAQVTGGVAGSGAMNGKALIYYRKAELAIRRGDLKGAVLQMKMAIAGDPQSSFLRTAMAEIEAELGKK